MHADLDDDRAFVRGLEALASLNRLLMLRALRTPRALSEIVVRDDGEGAPLARQTVRRHLDTLLDAGVVRTRSGEREYGETSEYVIDHQRLFAMSEDLRRLARLRPTDELEARTMPGAENVAAPHPRPCLVLVSGLDVGAAFDLRADATKAEWLIGRRRLAHVSLDFDAAVSSENALVRRVEDAYFVEDLPGSRNGTRVNGRLLAPGEPQALAHGDLIAVGRCLLLFWR